MGYRLVNLNENGFSASELAEINFLAQKKELSGVVQRALKAYFDKALTPPAPKVLKTEKDIDAYIEEYTIGKPQLSTKFVKKMMREKLLADLNEKGEVIL